MNTKITQLVDVINDGNIASTKDANRIQNQIEQINPSTTQIQKRLSENEIRTHTHSEQRVIK